jgi:DNA-directed RNA polymerase specialized sigma24 family protein
MSTVSKMQVQQLVAEERFLQALARSLLGDDEAARDVAQEAYLRALRRPPEDPEKPPISGSSP